MSADFLVIIQRLVAAEVDFVLIGGFAATVYGCTLVTQDLDICCDFSSENLQRLEKALGDFHPVHRMTPARKPFVFNKNECKHLKNLYLDTDIGVLDCLGTVSGVGDFDTVQSKSRTIETEGLAFQILSLNALIEAKQSLNRDRDQQAIVQLRSIQQGQPPENS